MSTHLKYSPRPRLAFARRTRQTGASLLEILIAILIMSFGITGIALLMTSVIQYNKMSQYQMVALQAASQLAESMRGNTDAFMVDAYSRTGTYSSSISAQTVPSCAVTSACTSAEIAAITSAIFANNLRNALPGGDYRLERTGTKADIWIMWLEPGVDNSLVLATDNCIPSAISGLSIRPRCLFLEVAL